MANPKITETETKIPDWEGALVLARLAYSENENRYTALSFMRAILAMHNVYEQGIVVAEGEDVDWKLILGDAFLHVTYIFAQLKIPGRPHPMIFKESEWYALSKKPSKADVESAKQNCLFTAKQLSKYGLIICNNPTEDTSNPNCLALKTVLGKVLNSREELNCLATIARYFELTPKQCMQHACNQRIPKLLANADALKIKNPKAVK